MTMRKEMEKLADLGELPDVGATTEARPASGARAKTAPGQLFQYVAGQREGEQAKERLAAFDGASPVRLVDPGRVRASAFRNRHEAHFASPEFKEFAAGIASAGGNTVPVRVRRVSGDKAHDYEIVYGHRRHRACLLAGVQLLAEIVDVDDRGLFEAMTRENVGRNDLSPWEWGEHYRRGLKLYTTQEKLAVQNDMSGSHVSYCLQLMELPDVIVEAFRSPLEIQLKWGPALLNAWKDDQAGARERASTVRGASASSVFRSLVGEGLKRGRALEVKVEGRVLGQVVSKNGAVTVRLKKGAVTSERVSELRRALQEFLARSG